MLNFGNKLKDLRTEKGYTQEELAKKIGVAKSTIAGYENGNREPDVFKIKLLIDIFGVTADELLDIPQKEQVEFSIQETDIILAYRQATDDDKAVVNAALRKYMGGVSHGGVDVRSDAG